MRHFKIMGLCLVAAFALAAVFAAGSASAAEPEWAGCVPQKHGNFTEEKCATVAEKHGVPDHKGHYEVKSGQAATCIAQKHGNYTESECKTVAEKHGAPDHKGHYEQTPSDKFTGEGGAGILQNIIAECYNGKTEVIEIEGEVIEFPEVAQSPRRDCVGTEHNGYTVNSNPIVECQKENATGEAAGTKEIVNVSVRFKSCIAIGTPATSAGLPAGEIQVNLLKGRLGYINKPNHEVGVLLEPAAGGGAQFAEFFVARGEIAVHVGVGSVTEGSFYESASDTTPGTPNGNDGVISPVTPVNVMTHTFTQNYRDEITPTECKVVSVENCELPTEQMQITKNIPNRFEGGPLEVLESYLASGPGSPYEEAYEWSSAGEQITNVNTLKEGYAEIKA